MNNPPNLKRVVSIIDISLTHLNSIFEADFLRFYLKSYQP